jgi:hypothetical protein
LTVFFLKLLLPVNVKEVERQIMEGATHGKERECPV